MKFDLYVKPDLTNKNCQDVPVWILTRILRPFVKVTMPVITLFKNGPALPLQM